MNRPMGKKLVGLDADRMKRRWRPHFLSAGRLLAGGCRCWLGVCGPAIHQDGGQQLRQRRRGQPPRRRGCHCAMAGRWLVPGPPSRGLKMRRPQPGHRSVVDAPWSVAVWSLRWGRYFGGRSFLSVSTHRWPPLDPIARSSDQVPTPAPSLSARRAMTRQRWLCLALLVTLSASGEFSFHFLRNQLTT
jgi:hypothetical protein